MMDAALHALSAAVGPHFGMGLVELFVKASLISVATLCIHAHMTYYPAAVRHRLLAGALFCLALIPLLSWVAPALALPLLQQPAQGGQAMLPPWLLVALATYLLFATLGGARLCLELLHTAGLSSRARPAPRAIHILLEQESAKTTVRLKISDEIRGPLTWGALQPVVLLPADALAWRESDLRMVLQHELAHISRSDWLVMLISRWVCLLYWPIPGLRRIFRNLSLAAEQACDDRVLAHHVAATDYADMLLRNARDNRLAATVSLGSSSELGLRVSYLVEDIVDRSTTEFRGFATVLVCTLLALPMATLHLGSPDVVYKQRPLSRWSTPVALATVENQDPARRPHKPAAMAPSPVWQPQAAELPPPPDNKPTIPPP